MCRPTPFTPECERNVCSHTTVDETYLSHNFCKYSSYWNIANVSNRAFPVLY
jgi:hypothetical protein